MATATLIQDRGKGYESRIGYAQGVPVGEKYYRVDSSSELTALATVIAAVPIGTAFDGTIATCTSADYDIVGRLGQWTIIRVGFGVIQSGGSIDSKATSTTAFHELLESAQQLEITADINDDPIKPTTKVVASNQLVVTGYRTGAQYLSSTTHWHTIRGKLNSGTVAIPAILNVSGSNFTAAAKELLAMSRRVTPVQTNLVRIDYTFGFGPAGTFQYIWFEEDEDGVPILGYQSDIYTTAAFTPSSLWG
jgi:hypothetical protein